MQGFTNKHIDSPVKPLCGAFPPADMQYDTNLSPHLHALMKVYTRSLKVAPSSPAATEPQDFGYPAPALTPESH